MFFTFIKPFQPCVTFHIETSHLICTANQMTSFYMKCNTELKWVKLTYILTVLSFYFFLKLQVKFALQSVDLFIYHGNIDF